MKRGHILVIDDEQNILTTLKRALSVEGYDVDVAGNAAIGLEKFTKEDFDLILLDVQLPDRNGLDLLREIQHSSNPTPVIMMSGHATTEVAVEATKIGAYSFLDKPIGLEHLLLNVDNCLAFKQLKNENESLRSTHAAFSPLLGESSAMNALRQSIDMVAKANAPVLITGERGSGKELVARAIHEASKRSGQSFEKLNCAAVPSELIESELFGHEAGAFTGATKQRQGKFERAHKGSLFLDEVGDMPSDMQAKLLRVLQEGEVERIGGSKTVHVDVRVISATNKDFDEEISEGRFRADLFDRLNVVPIELPPLRRRREDIALLATHFCQIGTKANDLSPKTLHQDALDALSQLDFPGNVRELRNLVERLLILTPADEIRATDVERFSSAKNSRSGDYFQDGKRLKEMVENAERDIIVRALEVNHDHVTKTAESLGLERSHLYKKMKALGIRKS